MKDIKKITITLSPQIIKQLENGNYNRSKLIDSLLKTYYENNKEHIKAINDNHPAKISVFVLPLTLSKGLKIFIFFYLKL